MSCAMALSSAAFYADAAYAFAMLFRHFSFLISPAAVCHADASALCHDYAAISLRAITTPC